MSHSTRSRQVSARLTISDNGIFYQLKNGCNWQDLPKDLPPYSTVYWYYKQWRSQGVLAELMKVLHSQVREQVKKSG